MKIGIFWCPYFDVAVDAIGPKTDFTLETNRKKVKEKLLKTIQNCEFYLLNLKFQTIKFLFFWPKADLISILKHVLGFQNHTGTLQQKPDV